MFKRAAIVLILLCTPVHADTFSGNGINTLSRGEVSDGWNLSILQGETGNRWCVLGKMWDISGGLAKKIGKGHIFTYVKAFPTDKGSVFFFELSSDNFKMTDGKEYGAKIFFSQRKRVRGWKDFKGHDFKFEKTSETHVGGYVGDWFRERFKSSYFLNVEIGKLDLGIFALDGSKAAMSMLEMCGENLGATQQLSRDTF